MNGVRLSIRSRLTLTIAVLTAVVGILAVSLGLRAFETQIRQRAIDLRVDEVAGLAEVELPIGAVPGLDDLSEDDLAEIFGEELEPEDLEDLLIAEDEATENLANDTLLSLIDLAEVGLADVLFERFGDESGVLHVLLYDGRVAAVPQSLTGVEVLVPDDVDDVLVPQDDLFELQVLSFEQFGDERAPRERDLETVVETVGGIRLGLVIDVTDELNALDGIRTSLWSAAAALTLLAGGATWLLTGRALRPVAAITRQVDDITSGTLDGRVPEPGTGDEIGLLAQTMNRMLSRLERSDLRRRQFVSDASHELRTPVAVLRSEAEVANRAPETTTVPTFARVVLAETGRLEGLVEDLLSLARADERSGIGARTSAPVEIDVDDIVLTEATRARRLPVDRSEVSAGRVIGRVDDLARAVGHLLDNAARHGESAVAVGVRTEGGRVRIWVDDDGDGVAEADRPRVFDRFVRLDEARTRDRGGSGLGLAVVAETAAAMGGTVTVGQSPLGGARFEIDLPAA